MKMLTSLTYDVKRLQRQLDTNTRVVADFQNNCSCSTSSAREYPDLEVENTTYLLPIDSQNNLQNLEELLNSEEHRTKLIKSFGLAGGNTMKTSLKAIIRRLFSKEMSLTYSRKDAKEKNHLKN